ncbi:hypothetical protein OS189_12295 [Sulfitobacter sp. F26169L]|uniref:hypothetical protein n=1 Tax=Sulfitobacter sp. F26169L TaxID=2996015 RepID=UPI002260EE27|nr:hypothetical protein [Sulfitobacter sp. F26169L]MCX7567124.1 hypothetical protein [Sulfitobacter sp. F26169L]
MNAEQTRSKLAALPLSINARYVLWNRLETMPVYVGTAKAPSRIKSHLQKDDKRVGPLGKLIVNKPFYEYVMNQPIGWLGISFDLFEDDDDARQAERDDIARFGMRPNGTLFNRRAGG